jgi:hypothetical protein
MTIETPTDEQKQKRADSLAKARAAKAEKRKEAQESPSRVMSADEVRARKAALMNEIASLPDDPVPAGAMPGTTQKDGLGDDKVPWTPATLRDACNRNLVLGGHRFEWKTVLGDGKNISVSWNGIVYWLWPDRENKIPSVHHAVYMQALEDRRREANRWRGPSAPGPGALDGFNSAEAHAAEIGSPSSLGHVMGVGPLEPRGE